MYGWKNEPKLNILVVCCFMKFFAVSIMLVFRPESLLLFKFYPKRLSPPFFLKLVPKANTGLFEFRDCVDDPVGGMGLFWLAKSPLL